ncbi:TPA: hypothetical protein ACG0MZ_000742 [Citrobacter farmeri]
MKTERISNLSLTTITRFTKEQLLKRLEEQMSSARYALGFVQDSEILRDIEMDLSLAEIARECLGARPVYFVEIEGDQDINAGRVEGKTRFDLGLLPDGINFLYANPPVVNSDPIYQVQYGNDWRDVERGQYDDHATHGSPVRIVYAAPPAPTVTFYRDGIEAAAMWVSQQRDAYDSEHGRHDPDTGSFEFGNDAQRDYSATLEEIAEGIRGLHPNTATPAPEDYFSSLVAAARIRADKAMLKFPQPNYVLNKVAEESGEVIKEVIHYTEGRGDWNKVEYELIDNLAMLIRLVIEGDQVIGFTPPDTCRPTSGGKS